MKHHIHSVVIFSILLSIFVSQAQAQVVLDGTLGTAGEKALSGPEYDILEAYGQRAGDNLFHSLKTFNINVDETANFSVASDVHNIIARITGGQSRINGTIQSTLSRSNFLSNANLFLLNSAGMVFGPEARLDLGGSFHVSTADYLQMGDQGKAFYSIPTDGETLSAAPPSAFGFLSDSPAGIVLEGRAVDPATEDAPPGLEVKEGQSISIIGGDIEINGLYENGYEMDYDRLDRVSAPAGQINIAAVAGPGDVSVNHDPADPLTQHKGRVHIAEGGKLTASGNGSGHIYIQSGAFVLDNGSLVSDNDGPKDGGKIHVRADRISMSNGQIYSDNQLDYIPEPGENAGSGGWIHLEALESIDIENNSHVFADTYFVSETPYSADDSDAYHQEGRAGSIAISAKQVAIASRSFVSSDTYGSANGGDILIEASESMSLSGQARIFSGTVGGYENDGNGGNIRIETPKFAMSDMAIINADTYYGSGHGGAVSIVGQDIVIDNSKILAGAVEGEGYTAGNGGLVSLSGTHIEFKNGAKIGSESLGSGRGGDVELKAENGLILFHGTNDQGEPSRIYTTAEGLAEAENTSRAGDAGNIVLNAKDIVFQDQGGVTASTYGPGNAGAIDITAQTLTLESGGLASSSSEARDVDGNVMDCENCGNAGQIVIRLGDRMTLNGDDVSITTQTRSLKTETVEGTKGHAGDILITSDPKADGSGAYLITISNGASITSASLNQGDGGNAGTIDIAAASNMAITKNGAITTEAVNAGGGRMRVSSENMLYIEDARIATSVQQGAGNGGDIDAAAPYIILKNGQIVAKAYEGRGGNINILIDQLIRTPDSVVSASSELGIDGYIFIENPVADISGFLTVLPDQFLDASQWVVKSCAEQALEDASRFIVKDIGGTPAPVDDWLASP